MKEGFRANARRRLAFFQLAAYRMSRSRAAPEAPPLDAASRYSGSRASPTEPFGLVHPTATRIEACWT